MSFCVFEGGVSAKSVFEECLAAVSANSVSQKFFSKTSDLYNATMDGNAAEGPDLCWDFRIRYVVYVTSISYL